jgi:hypothetical protein
MKNDGGSAFPWYNGVDWCRSIYSGMTIRQAYKMAAIQGLLASFRDGDAISPDPFATLSDIAGKYADAMLAEDAEKEEENG